MSELVVDALFRSAVQAPLAPALVYQQTRLDYAALARQVSGLAAAMHAPAGLGLQRGDRVAVYLEKRIETVVALFGAAAAGAVFVPVNPLLKDAQVAHILADCTVRLLVTSAERLASLLPVLEQCTGLEQVLVVGSAALSPLPPTIKLRVLRWETLAASFEGQARPALVTIDADVAAVLYTSGSTGRPKGVMLSHRNLVAGARSVASYLENHATDRLLAVLPLSFDYGLSQLTTAFESGACVVLINHLFARDIVNAVASEQITGLAAVPPLWIQLAQQAWPADCSLRYLTNSGGAMQGVTVAALQQALPRARLFLMYGLTEAFRSTYLPPEQIALRPGSMGRAIPNAEVLVVRADGSLCQDEEPGELVHRGALVSLGYWNDAEKTAQRFRPAPPASHAPGLVLPDMAVWSGDVVRRDKDGYLYFVGRNDEMIKVSGYRVSPTEVEEILHDCAGVREAAVFAIPHATLGQAIAGVVVMDPAPAADSQAQLAGLLAACRRRLPAYMVPSHLVLHDTSLPRNPNGKIDRKQLQAGMVTLPSGAGP
ncbi:MAG: acyl-CoA ligase (AMP-forming), exosortase A system-associated [Janthinobacterium lividum]